MTVKPRKHAKSILIILFALFMVAAVFCSIKPVMKLIYPIKFSDPVEEMAQQCSLPPSLIYAVIHTESKFDPTATSAAGAKGLMQITDDTHRWACKRGGVDASTSKKLYESDTNIRVGCYVLALLYEQFYETETVLAAYNAGQGRVREWLKDPAYSKDGRTLYNIPYEETENYVHRVINTQKKYQTLYNIP